ncbi:MAG: hypothetical protein II902_01725 [Selenomonadaceae bacterium]|nr:hypothetical protein [Selenomonadaceae bacterium]
MIILIDYGVGNLYSVAKAVASVGGDVKISSAADDLKRVEKFFAAEILLYNLENFCEVQR